MCNRWQMNRMGFVNFWLYDEEVFEFANGKILLRGQNASGKSITTQSFIPFILDGDRTPSRLDPFGSNDRHMEYYFLRDGEKDDVTGYLFLEFKKEGTEQYKTIGIGQRAKQGKGINFWGFIILDGRRIGYDLKLYHEVGSNRIPYQKNELKKLLGEDNFFTDVQHDYMEYVNKYIFGFPKLEQYEQFIRLLIKVRAPKLSKEFKPTKVYEILNESLQTLTDEDLRAMVDAMEKMDDIQNKLDNLKFACKDVESIRNEYERYNQYILAKKATAYLNEKGNVQNNLDKLELLKSDLYKQKENKDSLELENRKLNDDIFLLEKEKDSLNLSELEASVEKLEKYEDEKKAAEVRKNSHINNIEQSHEKIRGYDRDIRKHKNLIEEFNYKLREVLEVIRDQNEVIKFPRYEEVKTIVASGDNDNKVFKDIAGELKIIENSIDNGIEALKEFKRIEENFDKLLEDFNILEIEKENCQLEFGEAEEVEIECRDTIVDKYYIAAENYKEMRIEKVVLGTLVRLVKNYSGAQDVGEVISFIEKIRKPIYNDLMNIKIRLEEKKRKVEEDRVDEEKKLYEIMNMKDPIPHRSNKVNRARAVLQSKNIKCLPFYEAVEFHNELSSKDQDLLEEQLMNIGLLDALVVADKDYLKAKSELASLSDVLINGNNYGKSTFSKLVVADIDEELKETASVILSNIFEEEAPEHQFILSSNGYFKNGILEGYSIAEESASYVGALARKHKKQRLIVEKQADIALLDEALVKINVDMDIIEERITWLDNEHNSLPTYGELDQAIDMVREANNNLDRVSKFYDEKENELRKMANKKKEAKQEVIKICRNLHYTMTVEGYQEAKDCIKEYISCFEKVRIDLYNLQLEKLQYEHIIELIEREEENVDKEDLLSKQEERKSSEMEINIIAIRKFLNNPKNKEKAIRIEQIRGLLVEKNERRISNNTNIEVLKNSVSGKAKEIETLDSNLLNMLIREEKLRKYFEEELELGLVIKRESKSIENLAQEAINICRKIDKQKSISDMVTSLHRIYQTHSSNLGSYGTYMEDYFQDDSEEPEILRKRQCIVSIWQGKKLFLEEFYCILRGSIESTELLILQKDRELFENILADTLSRKLNSRIIESRKWIKDMSEMMRKIDTSMALTFSLEWKPKVAESDSEIDTTELEKLLSRDRNLLTLEDIERVSVHFRSKVRLAKQAAEEKGEIINYTDLVRDALDYRKWFEFKMNFYINDKDKKELTNSRFNKFSGGEKAMAMYVPLLAALNAQYKKSNKSDYPKIVALDEAFAGVDDKNIASMFKLVEDLKFDYIMNSQVLWGCYETVKDLRIAEFLRPDNSEIVTIMYYYWNGRFRILEEY